MLSEIEHLVRAGFAIHWLHAKSKRPIGNDWSDKPVKSVEELRSSHKTGNNVGVRLGKWSKVGAEFLLVIDVDIRKAELAKEVFSRLEELFPDYRSYPSVVSGSGGASRHFYILSDRSFPSKKLAHSKGFALVWDELRKKEVKKWDWEIELYGTGKQVAMPPSIHPDTGIPYRWERSFDIDDLDFGLGPTVSSDHIAELLNIEIGRDDDIPDAERLKPLGMSLQEIEDVLADIPKEYYRDDRDGWLTVGFALHHETEGSDQGYKLWADFSKDSEKFDKTDQKRVWKSFKGNKRPVRMATLVTAAREARLEQEMDNLEDLGDDFDDLGKDAGDGEFDDVLGNDKPSKRETKLRKAEVEKQLGHVPKRVERLNRKHAVAFVSGKTVIITENIDGTTAYGTPHELHNWYENDRVATEKSTQPVSKAWMQHKMRREYPNGITFAPGRNKEGYFNHWKGFDVEPDPDGSCAMFLTHLHEVICSGNDEYYRYALGWFAHMVQKPWEKPGVAMVLRGKKRIGKDTIADYFGGLIKRYHVTIANQDQMVGKFNAHQEKCLLLHVQEGFWAGNKQAEGALKYLITSTSVLIEPKTVNAFTVDSYLRLFISSNEQWVVPATADEGRYFVLDVSAHRKDDHKYFGAMKHEMQNGGLSALLHYLQNYDLSNFEVRKVPDTTALADQKIQGLKNLDKWWFSLLESGEPEFPFISKNGRPAEWSKEPIVVDRDDFRQAYSNWMRNQRYDGNELVKYLVGKRLRELCHPVEDRRRREGKQQIWTYAIPSLPECRKAFSTFMNSEIHWEDVMPLDADIDDEYGEYDDL
jgi:hypothetical protein